MLNIAEKLIPEAMEAYKARTLCISNADCLAKMPPDKQREKLADAIAQEPSSFVPRNT